MKFTKEQLIDLYINKGKTIKEIAEELNCVKSTIWYNVKKLGLSRPKNKPLIDLTGKKVGKLTVLKLGTKTRQSTKYWLCKCECGKTKEIDHYNLLKDLTKSCGCSHKEFCQINSKSSHYKWTGFEEITGEYWCRVKRNAKTRNLEFKISKEYAWNLYIKQNKKCKFTNWDIEFGKNQTASIDRIDSTKGYVEGNIQWTHKTVNCAKMQLSNENFINLCEAVVINEKNKNN